MTADIYVLWNKKLPFVLLKVLEVASRLNTEDVSASGDLRKKDVILMNNSQLNLR